MSIASPPSHCPDCDYKLKWYDNIPVLSYIILGGKCRNCKQHISFRYTAVEILNAVLWLASALLFWQYSIFYAVVAAITCSILICVCFIDLENMIIPDRFQIMLGVLAVAVTVYDAITEGNWLSHIIGGVVGFGVMYLIAFFGEKIAKREALGGGDIKLCGVMGLMLGIENLILSVLVASISASIILVILGLSKKEKGKEYPFAPFLSAAFIISIFFGDIIINSYMSLILNMQ